MAQDINFDSMMPAPEGEALAPPAEAGSVPAVSPETESALQGLDPAEVVQWLVMNKLLPEGTELMEPGEEMEEAGEMPESEGSEISFDSMSAPA
jgi:hypothetical protein